MCPDKIPILSVSLSAIISRPESFQLGKSSKIDSVWKTQKHQLADGSIKSQLRGAPDVYPNFCCYNLFQSNAGKKLYCRVGKTTLYIIHSLSNIGKPRPVSCIKLLCLTIRNISVPINTQQKVKFHTHIIPIVSLNLC